MDTPTSGTVKWYNPSKGYGFLSTADGKDIFVHRSAIADGRPYLIDGQGVEFSIRQGFKGPEAADLRVTRDVDVVPPSRQRDYEASQSHRYIEQRSYGERSSHQMRSRAPHTGSRPIPREPMQATVLRIDPTGRFMFVHAEAIGADVYVHSSLFPRQDLRTGDLVSITVEASERGLRARTLEP
jgi:cold shock CspA family protein